MAHFEEQTDQPYAWDDRGVYVIEREDPVDGGLDGVSNRQGRELTQRTRNLHGRLSVAEGEIDTLQEELPIAAEQAQNVAVGLAKAHTDGQVAAVRDELAVGDQAAINTAKAYADRIVAALVDNSPELLNTLEELAGALGNDPNFATTVMTEIGKRATMSEVNTALAGKAPAAEKKSSGNCNDWTASGKHYFVSTDLEALSIANRPCDIAFGLLFFTSGTGSQLAFDYKGGVYTRSCRWDEGWGIWRSIYHTGNLGLASTSNNGLMSKEDKVALAGKANASETFQYLGVNVGAGLDAYTQTGYGFDLRGPMQGTVLSVAGYEKRHHPVQLLLGFGNSRVMYRSRNDDKGVWSAWAEFHTSQNLKIIRGSVDINSYGIWCSGGQIDKIETNYVKVTHNIGHTRYSATATAHAETISVRGDNVVTVFTKAASYTTFIVTDGQGNRNEPTAFDFIIIAE